MFRFPLYEKKMICLIKPNVLTNFRRGKPLFLSADRYQLLESQWLTHRFDHTNRKWIWHRDSLWSTGLNRLRACVNRGRMIWPRMRGQRVAGLRGREQPHGRLIPHVLARPDHHCGTRTVMELLEFVPLHCNQQNCCERGGGGECVCV